ncbi:MAG: nucleotidyltransferase [Bacilli bacterium]|nr:nucleotidyltransferase [Bacilli bacterium]
MKIIGVIAEYNPFHLGHLYQINKIKEMYSDSLIIAIISTNFTERGDISILNKWDKTRICLENNIDMVIELPTLYATQSSDIFAYAALSILNHFKIDTLVFGSETDDINTLYNLANIQLNNSEYDKLVKEYMDKGINYPTAMSKALNKLTNINIDKPNDLLGLSYIKEIIKNNYKITPISIKRSNDYHGKNINNNIISANLIRKLLQDNADITLHVPQITNKYIYRNVSINNAFNLLKYKIINDINCLNKYLTVDEGIENRIIKYINKSNTWDELVMNIKTKRYTYNKINRMLIHILLGITKEDNNKEIYLRILGFNQSGRIYLNKIKKDISIPLFVGYKKNISHTLDLEYKSTYIYSLIVNDPTLIVQEYKNKPIIK